MPKFRVSYAIEGHSCRHDIIIELARGIITAPDVAQAIIKHEFPNLYAPFGLRHTLTAERALQNLGITQIKPPILVSNDSKDNGRGHR
jgi:hypothetical protein